jgi:uncharacterized membrane protein YdjX (TVP38/TMEM64 family)
MLCLGLVAAVAAALASPTAVVAELQHLATHPLQFGVALAVLYLVRPFLFWPVSGPAVVLGYLYDPVLALPVALLGAGLTGLPPFFIAKQADNEAGLLESLADPGRQIVDRVGEFRGVLAARLAPVPGDVVSYGAGLSEVGVGAFLLGTVVGEIPWAVVAIAAGNSMRSLTLSSVQPDLGVVVAIAALGVLVLSGPAYRHVRGDPVSE